MLKALFLLDITADENKLIEYGTFLFAVLISESIITLSFIKSK